MPREWPLDISSCYICRSHIHLHLGECQRRLVKCAVTGCNNYHSLGGESNHDKQYQESHQVLLKNEVQSLKFALFNKVRKSPLICGVTCSAISSLAYVLRGSLHVSAPRAHARGPGTRERLSLRTSALEASVALGMRLKTLNERKEDPGALVLGAWKYYLVTSIGKLFEF